jgi:hypothetical protein
MQYFSKYKKIFNHSIYIKNYLLLSDFFCDNNCFLDTFHLNVKYNYFIKCQTNDF